MMTERQKEEANKLHHSSILSRHRSSTLNAYNMNDDSKRINSNQDKSFKINLRFMIALSGLILAVSYFKPGLTLASQQQLSNIPNKHLIGVHPEVRKFYELNHASNFTCLDGSESIHWDNVNDNFCDCYDTSDEPGTPACREGKFFCLNEGFEQSMIPSSRVNDNVCDCCDGTDEYMSEKNCENTCGVLGEHYRAERERILRTADQGSAIRTQYKERAKQRVQQNQELLDQYKRELADKQEAIRKLEEELKADFGPSQVFLSLKGQCFKMSDREYTYTLCPFERATQESSGGQQTELGRWAGWAGQNNEDMYSKQKYEGGMQCWNGPTRSALVKIACGIEDKIQLVTEPSKCEYVFDFITPAACPDNDPPEQVHQEIPSPEHMTHPSLEVEDLDTPSEFNDEQNEAPDGGSSSPETVTHDEL